jgi:predicted transcriptional regulator
MRIIQLSVDRKKRIIALYFNQHNTYAEIAETEIISPSDINAIIKEEEARRLQYKNHQQQGEISSKAYELFSKGRTPVEVAVTLYLREPEVNKLYIEYCKLK